MPLHESEILFELLSDAGSVVEQVDVIVVGAGQAGLAVSHELAERELPHLVLERGLVGQTWRGRWESFCLVLPNWTLQLPGGSYDGTDPDGFMPKAGLIAFLEGYAHSFSAPINLGVEVRSLDPLKAGAGFALETSAGVFHTRAVVLATGAYQRPYRPPGAATLPATVQVIDAEGYANPAGLAPGKTLIVGSGQTGCQLAEEIHEAGRDVFLACGRTPWIPRRVDGRDMIGWLIDTGFFETTLSELPSPQARLAGNPQASGRDNGHDLHYRTLAAMGVQLLGHFQDADSGRLRFAGDLAESVAFGDQRYAELCTRIRAFCDRMGRPYPELPEPASFEARDPQALDLHGFGTVIFTSGFRPDYRRWVHVAGGFDELGFPVHEDCQSTVAPGLFFAGVHFLRKRKSSLLFGVGEDATLVARGLAEHLGSGKPRGLGPSE
jgi:putative flavoprotein involved in K+ transport